MTDARTKPNPQIAWAWYNCGILKGVEYRRRDAVAAVENHVGKPWSEARKFMEVHKVRVTKL